MKSRTLRIRHALFLSVFLFGIFGESWGQAQDVFSRSDAGTGSWWHDNNPWYYATWNNNQNRPDVNTRHYVKIGHNNNTSMTTNGAFFTLASLDFQSGASSARTISADAVSSGLSFTIGIYNYSSGTHSFSTNIGVDASTVFFQNNHTGGMNFSGIVYLNSNTADFGGTGSGNFDVSATLSGSNGKLIKNGSNTLVLSGANTYSGLTTINSGILQLNKTGGGTLPSGNSITVNSGGTLRISSNQTLNDLTINTGGIVIVDANVQLTIDGTLTNNGTLTLKTGATLDPGTSYAQAGNGVYNVEQDITGTGGATPSGRFWYVGSPVSSATSNVYDAAGSNVVKGWDEAGNAWAEIADNTTSLTLGKGYYIRAGADATLNFTGGELNNGAQTINLTRTGTTNSSRGFNLVSNPYPSYLDWDGVTRSSGVSSTIWYRTANASNVNVFDTYNASGGTGTNTNGAGAVTRYIPPMQSYWVFVTPYNTTGTISFDNADRSHYQSGVQGLRSTTQDFPMFLRLNVEQGANRDQIILYMKPEASSAYDQFDSDKMFLSGTPQLYTKIADKKLVINGMKNNKKQTSVPLFIDIPSSGLFTLHAEEFNVEDGLILLEDKQEQMIQDITLNDTYTFYAASGVCSNRFVIHFKMPNAVPIAQGPSNNWVDDQTILNEVGDVQITSDARGKVVITLDQAEDVKTEGMVQVTDANGRVVYSGALEGVQSTIQLDVPSGIYYLTVQAGNIIENKKVFIQD